MNSYKIFALVLVLLVVIDFIWLGFVAKDFYLRSYGDLARVEDGKFKPLLWAAGLVYVFLACGLVNFVLPSIPTDAVLYSVFLRGAFFGLIVYGVYDMTAMSVIRDWPLLNSFVDIIWGSVLCGVVTVIAQKAQEVI